MEGVPSDLGPLIDGLVTVVIAACGRARRTEVALAAACVPAPGGRLEVHVPAASGAGVLSALRESEAVSVLLERPMSHRALQLKGRCVGIRPAEDSERPTAERGIGAFFEHVERVGIPPEAVRRFRRWPCVVVTVQVETLFDQTPGPRAGEPYGKAR